MRYSCVSGKLNWVVLGLTLLALGSAASTAAVSQAGAQPSQTGQAAAPANANAAPVRFLPDRMAGRAGAYYKGVWGIDSLTIKWAESGELVRFSWRVLDPTKAALLNDKRLEPSLIDPQAGVSLVVPTMEKVGQMRQGVTPEAGKSYWMAFSNKGRRVKRGDRVNVVIGGFHAEYLVVE